MTQTAPQVSVTVAIDGERWESLPSLADAGPGDHVFTITNTGDWGTTLVEFGDGVHGAQPPAGSTMSVTYRTGGGVGGNAVSFTVEDKIDSTVDQTLWVAIRNRAQAIWFNSYRE